MGHTQLSQSEFRLSALSLSAQKGPAGGSCPLPHGVLRIATEAVSKVPAALCGYPFWRRQLPLQATFRFGGGGAVRNCTVKVKRLLERDARKGEVVTFYGPQKLNIGQIWEGDV